MQYFAESSLAQDSASKTEQNSQQPQQGCAVENRKIWPGVLLIIVLVIASGFIPAVVH